MEFKKGDKVTIDKSSIVYNVIAINEEGIRITRKGWRKEGYIDYCFYPKRRFKLVGCEGCLN